MDGVHLLLHELQGRPRCRLRQLLRRKQSTDFGDSGDCFACKTAAVNAASLKGGNLVHTKSQNAPAWHVCAHTLANNATCFQFLGRHYAADLNKLVGGLPYSMTCQTH